MFRQNLVIMNRERELLSLWSVSMLCMVLNEKALCRTDFSNYYSSATFVVETQLSDSIGFSWIHLNIFQFWWQQTVPLRHAFRCTLVSDIFKFILKYSRKADKPTNSNWLFHTILKVIQWSTGFLKGLFLECNNCVASKESMRQK